MSMVEFAGSGRARNRVRGWISSASPSKNLPLPRRHLQKSRTSSPRRTPFPMIGILRTFRDYARDRALRVLGALMSLNDPQWGRRPNQGPPDLEEIWRDFNRKLNGL